MQLKIISIGLSVLMLCYSACEVPSETSQRPPESPADRETWDARLEIQGPEGFRAEIRNVYERYFSAGQITQGDSGVQVIFYDSMDTAYSRLEAERLHLAHKTQELALAGNVRLNVGDSLQIYADSLTGMLRQERWLVPGLVRLQGPRGYQEGRNLEANFSFGRWSMDHIKAQLEVGSIKDPKILTLSARWAQSIQAGEQWARYEEVEVEYDRIQIKANQAVYDSTQILRFSGDVVSVDSLRRIQAKRLSFYLQTETMQADSNVVLEEDGRRLQAEKVFRAASRKHWRVEGVPAIMQRQGQQVSALVLLYDSDANIVEAAGDATFQDGEQYLIAGRLRYYFKADTLTADKGIVLHIDAIKGKASADTLFYDIGAERVVLRGTPRCQIFSTTDTLVLAADHLEVDLKSEKLVGRDNFKVTKPSFVAQARYGIYAYGSERLELRGEALLEGQLEDGYHRLQADSLLIDLEEGILDKIEAPTAVQGVIEAYNKSIAWLEATTARAYFKAGTLEHIELRGNVDMTQNQLAAEEKVNRFLGDLMGLHFGTTGQLQRLKIFGAAQMWSSLPAQDREQEPAINYIEGDSLEVFLENGSLAEVQGGASTGRYYPPPRATE